MYKPKFIADAWDWTKDICLRVVNRFSNQPLLDQMQSINEKALADKKLIECANDLTQLCYRAMEWAMGELIPIRQLRDERMLHDLSIKYEAFVLVHINYQAAVISFREASDLSKRGFHDQELRGFDNKFPGYYRYSSTDVGEKRETLRTAMIETTQSIANMVPESHRLRRDVFAIIERLDIPDETSPYIPPATEMRPGQG